MPNILQEIGHSECKNRVLQGGLSWCWFPRWCSSALSLKSLGAWCLRTLSEPCSCTCDGGGESHGCGVAGGESGGFELVLMGLEF